MCVYVQWLDEENESEKEWVFSVQKKKERLTKWTFKFSLLIDALKKI